MSANLWNLNEPLTERMSRFSAMVAELRPDVIAMQEVCPLPGTTSRLQLDLVDALAEYHLHYCVAHTWPEGNEGLAIASRLPVVESRSYRLPDGPPEFEPARAVQYLRLAWGDGGGLGVLNTHLAYHHTSEGLRTRQAEFVGDLAQQLAERHPADGLVVCGDLNAVPDSLPVSRLQSLAGLTNPWLPLSQQKSSFASANPYLADYPDQDSWLDYVLTRGVATTRLRLLDDWPDGPASDHCFVLAEIEPPAR